MAVAAAEEDEEEEDPPLFPKSDADRGGTVEAKREDDGSPMDGFS